MFLDLSIKDRLFICFLDVQLRLICFFFSNFLQSMPLGYPLKVLPVLIEFLVFFFSFLDFP
jgi:hypothetical protein